MRAINIGSITSQCVPWTRGGSRKGFAHKDIPLFFASRREHIAGKFDMTFIEQAFDFPMKELYVKPMQQHHRVIWAKVGPERLGIPMSCLRCFGFLSLPVFPR